MNLEGALALRDNRPVVGYCPIERTMAVVGTRSAMLVLREAFYGASRFEEFAARADLTDGTTSSRLRDLVEAGILEKRPYQEPGQRRRHEYALTPAGEDLMPALLALLGERINSLRLPFGRGDRDDARPHGWTRWAEGIGRHPVLALVTPLVVLVVLAIPTLQLQLGQQDSTQAEHDRVGRVRQCSRRAASSVRC